MLQFSMKITSIAMALALLVCTAHARPHKSEPLPTESYLIADSTGQILEEQQSDVVRPIASISKLMTTLLASEQDLVEQLDVPSKREVETTIPHRVNTLSRHELITLALVKSDNFAAQILCNNLPNCIDRMNEKAKDLGMINTHFAEPTGLDKENVSTAQDLLKLILIAATNPILTEASSQPKAEIPITRGVIRISNTNPLTSTMPVILSKTGFTKPAGGCIVMMIDTESGPKIYILLGSKNTRTRIPEIKRLVDHP